MDLKIRKAKNGTYYVPSVSMRTLRQLMKPRPHPRKWRLSKDETKLILE